jgi:hypothetical protein
MKINCKKLDGPACDRARDHVSSATNGTEESNTSAVVLVLFVNQRRVLPDTNPRICFFVCSCRPTKEQATRAHPHVERPTQSWAEMTYNNTGYTPGACPTATASPSSSLSAPRRIPDKPSARPLCSYTSNRKRLLPADCGRCVGPVTGRRTPSSTTGRRKARGSACCCCCGGGEYVRGGVRKPSAAAESDAVRASSSGPHVRSAVSCDTNAALGLLPNAAGVGVLAPAAPNCTLRLRGDTALTMLLRRLSC